jgi:hypothetical protein
MKADRKALVEKAAKFLADTNIKGTVQMKMSYLKEKQGLSDAEIMEAINIGSGGELVRSALGND